MTYRHRPSLLRGWLLAGIFGVSALAAGAARAHIIPPEDLHPVAESYRRMGFLLRLNPVQWPLVETETSAIASGLAAVAPAEAASYRTTIAAILDKPDLAEPAARKAAAKQVFIHSTRAVVGALQQRLELAREALDDHSTARRHLEEARQIWAAFEPSIAATDPEAFREIGACWLELTSALGSPGLFGVGVIAPDREAFAAEAGEMIGYLETNFSDAVELPRLGPLAPIPARSPSADQVRALPARLPPGSNINKQLPRPRQVLNMAERGVDESETTLIALGDMAFDSSLIFGEPAKSLGISCNTCHNKSITNPGFFIPGLSSRPGNVDVSNAFFAPHANNGVFDPIDIPDLRGIRFTSPYGRNGRFESLREFTRNVIVNEFNGPEPDPVMLDGMIAYMLEFDFLPNPALGPDGRLRDSADEAAKRGEEIFHRPFEQMDGRSCATCHVPSDHFVDRKRHDVGTVTGASPDSRDRALDTPTLLSAATTGPYFHDGSQPTLRAAVEWFDRHYQLGLSADELADLTAFVEIVGAGVEAYEDTIYTLEAELEEFSFFLSAYEFLRERGKSDLVDTTFGTIAFEIRAHKWDVQDPDQLPVLDRLAELMDEARDAHQRGDFEATDRHVDAYRALYQENAEVLR